MKFMLVVILLFMSVSCSENLFQSFSEETTDDALYIDAYRAVNQKDWATAITKIQSMSASKQTERTVIFLLASAYGGQCGLEFVPFASGFGDLSGGLYPFLLTDFVDSDSTSITACVTAQETYDQITSSLTVSDYLNQVFLAMAVSGNILNSLGANASNTLDPAFDPCNDIPDDEASYLFTSLSRIITNLSNAGLSGSGGLSDVSGLCTDAGLDCDKTDIADVNANERAFVKSLVNTNELGLSVCTDGAGDISEPLCLCAP